MPRKSVINELIDQSIGRLVESKGEIGFTYEDVEMRVRTELGGTLQTTLAELGAAKLRDRIRDRARAVARGQFKGLIALHPTLQHDDLALVYPVKRKTGETIFKQITHLNADEFSCVLKDLISQRKGLDAHVRALRRAERKLSRVWKANPHMTVEQAQGMFDLAAAAE